jgi:hypothetical protein
MKHFKGLDGVTFNDVFFTEADVPKAPTLKDVKVVIKHQNASLDDVKFRMAEEAKAVGANAIKNFRYGQRIMSTFRALLRFQWEIEYWHGEGEAIKL